MMHILMERVATPARGFKWRDRHGEMHAPQDMETRHLFYTLRMIWNHTMPEAARLPGNLYALSPQYTQAYMLEAIRALGNELANRDDLTAEWSSQLQRMINWLGTHQLKNEKEKA